MTVGGSTIGIVTKVSIAGASRHRVVLSHWARGNPATPRTKVVTAASFRVKASDCQRGNGMENGRPPAAGDQPSITGPYKGSSKKMERRSSLLMPRKTSDPNREARLGSGLLLAAV